MSTKALEIKAEQKQKFRVSSTRAVSCVAGQELSIASLRSAGFVLEH